MGIDGTKGKQFLKDYLNTTDQLFERFLRKEISAAAKISKVPAELMKRFLNTARRGKKIRGSLVTLGYQLTGGQKKQEILDASLFIELFHAGVLVHDDFMDQDHLRRGLPTLHLQYKKMAETLDVSSDPLHYGESMAVNIGDLAYYLSWKKLMESDFSAEARLRVSRLYAEYIIRVVHGQILDLTITELKEITKRDVLKVLKYKSAEYTGVLPLLAGAALANEVSSDLEKALISYGLNFGWAFQIQDDILGMFGDQKDLGKPVGSDLEEGKQTLLMLHLAKHGTYQQRQFQREVLGKKDLTEQEIKKMQQVLKKAGSYEYVLNLGWEYVEKGKAAITRITDDPEKQKLLESLIVYMMERTQ